ncbi:hypothetical protein EJ05DRAFT_376792 [Pseudovirgaria hyperparasitica]|uniref:Xylanolytic transcriptional activator regulatory domain-containing protein n=1 Tax=Pseudovirgaria hyperparasitica TaxID=470096 RepID=A0A6A6W7A9_9PEZI|nr:uncharacterized protein EJ05DRAFT_376792 [Pseudovirgaria hyperparasitica]KAF2758089.1 hypothetical protein EJ05DRAFT_376792 [Pseudovirgaria hyperparasitica]
MDYLARPEGPLSNVVPRDPGLTFFRQARGLMSDVIELNCIRAVQASFVIGVYLLPANAIGSSYVYLGIALRKALALDLHLAHQDTDFTTLERELRRRLWWSIYSLERNTTLKLNRPRSIAVSTISAPLPSELPQLDAQQAFNNLQHQIANARLTLLLDQLQDTLDPQKYVSGIEHSLKTWKRSLPPSLRLCNAHPKSSNFRAVFHLHLNYHIAWIFMGKLSVLTMIRANLQYDLGRSSTQVHLAEHEERLARACIGSANKILHMFQDMQSTGNLTRFSFTDFQGCSIATVIIILSGMLERNAIYERVAAFGKDCLESMAEGNATARAGVKFVEAVRSIADEAVSRMRQSQRSTSHLEAMPLLSDYEHWAQWIQQADNVSSEHNRPQNDSEIPAQSPGASQSTVGDRACHTTQNDLILGPGTIPTEEELIGLNIDCPITVQRDDPTFLMGLTGLDMLDFGSQDSGFDAFELDFC